MYKKISVKKINSRPTDRPVFFRKKTDRGTVTRNIFTGGLKPLNPIEKISKQDQIIQFLEKASKSTESEITIKFFTYFEGIKATCSSLCFDDLAFFAKRKFDEKLYARQKD